MPLIQIFFGDGFNLIETFYYFLLFRLFYNACLSFSNNIFNDFLVQVFKFYFIFLV